jgi:phasin
MQHPNRATMRQAQPALTIRVGFAAKIPPCVRFTCVRSKNLVALHKRPSYMVAYHKVLTKFSPHFKKSNLQELSMTTDPFSRQVQDFTRQAQEMFSAGKDAKIPENMSAFAEDAVAKTRDAYNKMNHVTKDNAKVMEDVMLTAQAGAKSIGEKLMANTLANTEAAFDAAQAMAKAKTFPEIARLQANYWQQQFAAVGAQQKELFELSSKVAKQTFDTVGSATAKSFEQMKKAG